MCKYSFDLVRSKLLVITLPRKCIYKLMLYTLGPVSLKERLLYTLNKLFVKQVKSFLLLLDLDPFILQCSLHNIKYIKFTVHKIFPYKLHRFTTVCFLPK